MFKCPRCNQEFLSYVSLAKHTKKIYNLVGEALYREYHSITEIPTCKCGCGTPTKWRIDRGYGEYVSGHNAKGSTNPMFGKTHSQEVRNNISTTRKEKFANGEYDFINSVKWSENQKQVWNRDGYSEKMKNAREIKDWCKKLSQAKTGNRNPWYGKSRPEHSKLMKSQEMMEKIFEKRSMTDIERAMVAMLEQLNIPYYSQFFITHEDSTYAYDFKIKNTNILIEVDGDYWHGGPSVKQHVPYVNEVKKQDAIKTQIAQQHDYIVLRFWGSDVKERPFWVVSQLLEQINNTKTPIV